jgi:hypothetical protein
MDHAYFKALEVHHFALQYSIFPDIPTPNHFQQQSGSAMHLRCTSEVIYEPARAVVYGDT